LKGKKILVPPGLGKDAYPNLREPEKPQISQPTFSEFATKSRDTSQQSPRPLTSPNSSGVQKRPMPAIKKSGPGPMKKGPGPLKSPGAKTGGYNNNNNNNPGYGGGGGGGGSLSPTSNPGSSTSPRPRPMPGGRGRGGPPQLGDIMPRPPPPQYDGQ